MGGHRAQTPFALNWLVNRIHDAHIAAAAQLHAGGRLLDVGCGARPHGGVLAPYIASHTGLEFDRVRYAETPPDCWGSALDLPFRDESFDTVLAAQVLEHLPEPARACAEIGRVLKPGGYLILSAPHIWGVHEPPHDYFRFTGYGLEYLARKAGLEAIDVRPMAGYWVTAGARFCYYLHQFDKAGLGWLVRPFYALVQVLAWGLDGLHRVDSEAWNFILVARKGECGV